MGISHIDTRKLVRHLRTAGVMRAGIFSGDALLDGQGEPRSIDALLDDVRQTPQMKGMSLYDEVSTKERYVSSPPARSKARNRWPRWPRSIWASRR